MSIRFFQLNRMPPACRRHLPDFKKACEAALGPKGKRRGDLNVIFTTNPEIRRINKRYLSHDFNTDVIAFPYQSPSMKLGKAASEQPFGDVYVSVDQARIQAKDLKHSLLKELLTLAIHGTLHLMGYDDRAPKDRKKMFSRQDQLLKNSGLDFAE